MEDLVSRRGTWRCWWGESASVMLLFVSNPKPWKRPCLKQRPHSFSCPQAHTFPCLCPRCPGSRLVELNVSCSRSAPWTSSLPFLTAGLWASCLPSLATLSSFESEGNIAYPLGIIVSVEVVTGHYLSVFWARLFMLLPVFNPQHSLERGGGCLCIELLVQNQHSILLGCYVVTHS